MRGLGILEENTNKWLKDNQVNVISIIPVVKKDTIFSFITYNKDKEVK